MQKAKRAHVFTSSNAYQGSLSQLDLSGYSQLGAASHKLAVQSFVTLARQAKSSQIHYKQHKLGLTRVCFSVQVVYAKLEAAKLKISTMKAQLITSHEAADSARAAADSLAEQMRTSANTDLSKVTEAAKLLLLLENSQANVVSTEQQVKRFEQQLAGSQTAAAQLKAALTAANNKAGAEAAAAAQQAQVHQQQLDALLADQPASAENTRVTLSSLSTHRINSPARA